MKYISRLGLLLLLAGCTIAVSPPDANVNSVNTNSSDGQEVVNSVSLQTDYTGAKVDRSDLAQGCLGGKDCIPSIDEPVFETMKEVNEWLNDDDTIFTLEFNGVERVYPQRIMNWHEIVNDVVGDTYIAVTFCPLCGSATAFERKVNGTITEFGVSGKLHNSDLVMYDRLEGNLWQQITGEAIVGPAAQRDEVLEDLLVTTTTWGEWKIEHSESDVLSRETGYIRDYGRYPYGTYEEDGELYFGVEDLDSTLQIKTPVYGFEHNGVAKAYTEEVLEAEREIRDVFAGEDVTVTYSDDGTVQLTVDATDEIIVPIRLFWFAWAAFHPDTELYVSN